MIRRRFRSHEHLADRKQLQRFHFHAGHQKTDITTSVAHRLLIGGYRLTTSTGEEYQAMPSQSDDVLRRVRGEYIEMPGLRLTTAQAQRLWGLDRAACDALLGALVDANFLSRTRDGAFVRSESVRVAS